MRGGGGYEVGRRGGERDVACANFDFTIQTHTSIPGFGIMTILSWNEAHNPEHVPNSLVLLVPPFQEDFLFRVPAAEHALG